MNIQEFCGTAGYSLHPETYMPWQSVAAIWAGVFATALVCVMPLIIKAWNRQL